jgi:hypothetical protein
MLKTMKQPELFNANSTSSLDTELSSSSYWDILYFFVLHGDLHMACEILKLHSEIKDIILLSKQSSSKQYSKLFADLNSILDLLLTHPYASLVVNDNNNNNVNIFEKQQQQQQLASSMLSTTTIAQDFAVWQHRVTLLRQACNQSSLLRKIPQLDTMMRVLEGDKQTLTFLCVKREWTSLTLSMLLYVYPPPLTKTNLTVVVDEAVALLFEFENDAIDKFFFYFYFVY